MKESYKNTCFKKILEAEVYDVAIKSPLEFAKNLSKRLKNKIFIKREDLQPVFSFKLRGAYNKIAKLINQKNIKKLVALCADILQAFQILTSSGSFLSFLLRTGVVL